MANVKAQAAKDKGNAAFKAADYPTAIGHYTTAIIADRDDPTYPLNRAAAYLKLGKNEDAERDCTTVLSLSKQNVKALFRRGQARMAMGKLLESQKDISNVLLIEPSNTSAQEEMKKLTTLIQQERAKKSKPPVSVVAPQSESLSSAKRRRVPIKILDRSGALQTSSESPETVGVPSAVPSTPDIMNEVSSRSLKSVGGSEPIPTPATTFSPQQSSPSTSAPTTHTPKAASFKDAKHARESTRPSRVGGGIFRASGESTIFSTEPSSTTPPSRPQNESSIILPPKSGESSFTASTQNRGVFNAPTTLFDWNRAWGSLNSSEERWQYFTTIPPSTLPALCQTSLEPSLLVAVMEMFLAVLSASNSDPDIKQRVIIYMDNFAKVSRFEILLLFLSRREKGIVKQVWTMLGLNELVGIWAAVA